MRFSPVPGTVTDTANQLESISLDSYSSRVRGDLVPRLTRFSNSILKGPNPFGTGAVGQTLLWASPMYVGDKLTSAQLAAIGNHPWVVLYSTDHDTGPGGVFLATAASVGGPYSKRNGDGSLVGGTGDPLGLNGTSLFSDGAGSQTETPSPIYVPDDPDNRPFYCFAQRQADIEGQVTKLWTSANLLTWVAEPTKLSQVTAPSTKQGKLFQNSQDETQSSSRHSGYFAPFYWGGGYAAYSLFGAASGASALWYSNDCRKWLMDKRSLRPSSNEVGNANNVSWFSGGTILHHGQLWHIGRINNFTSGGGGGASVLSAWKVSRNLRQDIGPPVQLLTLDGMNESTDLRSVRLVTGPLRRTYVFYQTGQYIHVARIEAV